MESKQQGRILISSRLELQILEGSHSTALLENANDLAIADTMISVPHPFLEDHAREWADRAASDYQSGSGYHWGIFNRISKGFAGYVTLRAIDKEHSQAELSFWISRKDWGKGYAKEACATVLEFAFEMLKINRIYAHHMVRNPASGKVLLHLGFLHEGLLRQRVIKWGKREDVVLQALLREDWEQKNH